MARVAPARGRRRSRRPPDHVRHRRRAAARRARARVAARLRGLDAGAGRQRRVDPAPARRLRRGARRAVPDARLTARRPTTTSGRCTRKLLEWLEEGWREKDAGIWEVRGPARHFTHSKMMAWVAFDRAVRVCTRSSAATGRSTRWRALRDEIHAEVLDPRLERARSRPSPSRTARTSSTRASC